MRNSLKLFLATILGFVGVYVFVLFFSATESRFECNGVEFLEGKEAPKTAFIRLVRYRWWVGLWSDSWGTAWIEIPNQTFMTITHIEESGDFLILWESQGNWRGNFSTLSNSLGFAIRDGHTFEGACKEI